MFYVWTNWEDKSRRLRVAGSSEIKEARRYGEMYTEEGIVTIKKGNKIIARMYPQKESTNDN